MDLIEALRDERLDAEEIRALLDHAGPATPREDYQAILRDEAVPRLARRLVVRRLLEEVARPGATLAALGALIAADEWLQPTHVRHVSVVIGKIPVRWLAEDRVVAIDVFPAVPGSGDRHRLIVYLRVAGQPEVEEIVRALRGEAEGAALAHEVREVGFSEPHVERAATSPGPAAGPRPPVISALLLCRRALCDSQTGAHTLVDVVIELPAELPGPAMFDVYLQLRRLTAPATLTLEVIGPGPPEVGGEVVLATGTLTFGSPDDPEGIPPAGLGVAIPSVTVSFQRAGEHRVRVRAGGEILGEHLFHVTDRAS